MTINATGLGAFGALAKALGLLDASGSPNASWFGDPLGAAPGTGGNQHGLRDMLSDDDQRTALLSFVDDVLGPPDRAVRDGETWVPLFVEADPHITIYAVVGETASTVRLGLAIEHTTAGGPPTVSTRVHVPVFQFARGSAAPPPDNGDLPGWLLLGSVGGRVEVSVDATFTTAAPPAGQASLAGVAATLAVPTTADDDFHIGLTLRDLQLPGAGAPRTFSLDAASLDELGSDVFDLVTGLVRAQADAIDPGDATFGPFAAIAGLLGLRDVAHLPPLPLADLPTRGVSALVGWVEQVLADPAAVGAWFGQLQDLIGGTVDPLAGTLTIPFGPLRVIIGLRVTPGTAGHPVLVPSIELALDTRTGVRARLHADLLRADTGTGVCTALPDLRVEAVFGADAGTGSPALLPGTDPHVGSLHVGFRLDGTGRPAFLLTLVDVTVGGAPHPLLDLSSPAAALDSASSVLEGALANAISALGSAGSLVNGLLGLDPPAGITALNVPALFADPLAEVMRYWHDLTASPAAAADVLGRLRALLAGGAAAAAPGDGTAANPWQVTLVAAAGDAAQVDLRVWRDGDALLAAIGASIASTVLGDYRATASVALTLLRVDLSGTHVTFATEATGGLSLARVDGHPAQLGVGPVALEATSLSATLRWTPQVGLRASLDATGLALVVAGTDTRIAFTLPTWDAGGHLVLAAPDWDALERVLAMLLARLGQPLVNGLVSLVGWDGSGPHLPLSGLLGADPQTAVRGWLADLILDCDRVRTALAPVASLLSGFALGGVTGAGSDRSPYRCPVAGEPRAPGLAVWLDPGCVPAPEDITRALAGLRGREAPDSAAVVAALRRAAESLPDLADLLVGRDSLADGLDLLVTRWAGTDGLVGQPATLPDGVTGVGLPGRSYEELVALGSHGTLLTRVLDPEPTAVVHVGCEATWAADRGGPVTFDRSAAVETGSPATVPATGDGTWYVRLPTPAVAGTARPDRGGVGEQAARLQSVLAGRTDPVTVVAYGAAAAAALRAAAATPAIATVVTVGAPWATLAVDSLAGGLGGDALRLLGRLIPAGDTWEWPDELLAQESTLARQAYGLVRRCTDLLTGTDLPSAATEARRDGLSVHAVFGDLDPDQLAGAIGEFVDGGVQARYAAATAAYAAGPEPTALHAGVSLPVLDLNLGGLLVGVGATVEMCRLERGDAGALTGSTLRGVIVDVHLGVHDGWLVGGPGAASTDGDLRWMSARISVPLDDRPGDAELVLHEATAFGIDQERWVVRADAAAVSGALTTVVPEVRVLLGDAITRVRAASADLAALLDLVGLTRAGGLDPTGLDRLMHDTGVTLRAAFAAGPTDLATRLRALIPGAGGSGATLTWTVGAATLGIDLAASGVTAGLHLTAADTGSVAIDVDVALGPTGATGTLSVGTIDPNAGGLRLVGGSAPASLAVEWSAPAAPVRRVTLLPAPDPAALTDLVTVVLPAIAGHTLLRALRGLVSSAAAPALDTALDAVGLLTAPDAAGGRDVVVPVALVTDPGGWLRHAVTAWRTNAAASAVALLDALAPLVVPGRGATPGWPLADGLTLTYQVDGDRLRLATTLTLATDIAGSTVTTNLSGGLVVGADGRPAPTISGSVDVDGRGLRLVVDTSAATPVRLSLLRPAPATELPLYPDGPGLGQALSAIGETVLPPVLNAVAGHRSDAPSLLHDVGQAVFDLGSALDLVEAGQFTGARITTFANDPAAALLGRLPQLVTTAAASLAAALDPSHAIVTVTGPTGNKVTLGFGHGTPVRLVLDASGPVPAVEIQADAHIPGIGQFSLQRLRLSTAGVDVSLLLGPIVLDVGAFALRPLLVVRAGSAAGSDRLIGIGLALDDLAARSVEVRWAVDATPPTLSAVSRTVSGESAGTPEQAALWLLSLGVSLAGGVLVDGLHSLLTPKAIASLQGVVFADTTGSTRIDPGLAADLLHPEALLGRLKRLLWNAAAAPALSVTIDGTVTIGLARDTAGPTTSLGLSVNLAPGKRFTLADGDSTRVELEVDATWVDPAVDPGLSVYVLAGTSPADLEFAPGVSIAGVGLRFTNPNGPLLSLGPVALDGIAVHVYGEASTAGVGGGANLELTGLAFAPAGGSAGNPVANSIMTDAGAHTSPSARPAFSPSLAIQKHPGHDLAVSLRAGPPPGPWWIVIQRQLGPLYLEQVGFNTVETGGTVSRVTLLFDGKVSIFGLTAEVDQLSISWLGGDVFDIASWGVDLMGLAISADMSGVSLVGGILKTIGPPADTGPVSYVGMLMGKFGTYGLSVFGGYTDDNGNPSFFVFGAINGPIGGPPAFFLTGLGGGLGINRGLKIPEDVTHFNEFPFIQALDPAAKPPADPMDELRKLNVYFPPQSGNFWFAAGISFTCFALVDGVAVVAVSFGDGLEIDLLGLARLALPRPQAALVSIELGLLAKFSTTEGVFIIRAGLTSNSWLLYHDVHLTGGFAFATWWKGPLSGQFVMTLGGYHPDFHRDGYPDVPRLGLCWQVSDAIVIKGGSYFALTSEALMAGVDVEASADFGWAWARVAFGANGLVYFDPFWFEAEAYARISAGITIDTWLGTISFSISMGASVKVWGPDFSGEASFDVGPCTVTVPFGSGRKVEPAVLTWTQFVAKYLEDAGDGSARALSSITGRGTLPAATGGKRDAPTSDGSADQPFEVFSEFELTVQTTVPTAQLDLGLPGGPVAVPVNRSDGASAQLGLSPMKAANLASTLRMTLAKKDDATGVYTDIGDQLAQLGANLAAASPRPEGSLVARDAFPIGAWGQPGSSGASTPALPKGDVLFAGNQVKLVAEATAMHRGPEIDYYRVEASRRPLPLQATGPDRGVILSDAAGLAIAKPATTAAALTAASALLFAPATTAAPPAGVLAPGTRSGLARASYRGEVAAPPLFGTLADGMVAANAADATASRGPAPAGPGAPTNRPPVLAGYVTSGAGAATRPTRTIVSDSQLVRRPAPTVESVRAAVGRLLPAELRITTTAAVEMKGTLVAARPPRTVVPGTARSYPQGSAALAGLLGAQALAAGDVVTLAMPDAAVDTAAGHLPSGPPTPGPRPPVSPPPLAGPARPGPVVAGRAAATGAIAAARLSARPEAHIATAALRPVLSVDGSARITALRGDGSVIDDTVVTAAYPVPVGTELIAAQADGTLASGDGVAGWIPASRVCALGSHAALAAGCVITSSGTPTSRGVAWTTAATLLAGAATVTTRFASPVRAVGVVLEGGGADRVDGVGLDLGGARRVRGADGQPRPPLVVHAGSHLVLVYAVEAIDPAAGPTDPGPAPAGVTVAVRAGGDWRVSGVLGGAMTADNLATLVVRRGLSGAVARLLATAGDGCRLSWKDPADSIASPDAPHPPASSGGLGQRDKG